MLNPETAGKLKKVGFPWEPQVGDEVYYKQVYLTPRSYIVTRVFKGSEDSLNLVLSDSQGAIEWVVRVENVIPIPRLNQIMKETDKQGYWYELTNTGCCSDGTKQYACYVYRDKENDDDFVSYSQTSETEAAARAYIWIKTEQEKRKTMEEVKSGETGEQNND